ncbi:MAG: TerB N-terminal domain-containing protein, partial [Magnetococcales bacterium]|nr:TerB N-terminal domain-containing protein [Magnetococcales bacterium]
MIQGFTIPNGMIYVGDWLTPIHDYGNNHDASLIRPSLAVNKNSPDHAGDTLSYWPSYSDIKPRARAAYLSFLSKGVQDPDVAIGYLFLYYYGLERRLLVDLAECKESPEFARLIQELNRLADLYGDSRSFQGYVSNLLSYLSLRDGASYAPLSSSESGDQHHALWLKLGRTVKAGAPIDDTLALHWLHADGNTRFRTPAKRLPDEFRTLFKVRFNQLYPQGMKLRPNKSRLTIAYRPSARACGGSSCPRRLC